MNLGLVNFESMLFIILVASFQMAPMILVFWYSHPGWSLSPLFVWPVEYGRSDGVAPPSLSPKVIVVSASLLDHLL